MKPFVKSQKSRFANAVLIALCAVTLLMVQANAAFARPLLTSHVHEDVANGHARFLQRLAPTRSLRIGVVLALRDPDGLQGFLKTVYDPKDPGYRKYLTPQEFTARFGPTAQDYDTVVRYARAHGFTVEGGSLDGMLVQLTGSVAAIEAAFHVTMGLYEHPTENRTFYSPDREPSTDLAFSLWHISGLDNFSIPRPASLHRDASVNVTGMTSSLTGSGPSGNYLGSDMRAAYYGGTALTGAGQHLGLAEFEGIDLTDLNTYYSNVGQTYSAPINLISVDGTPVGCTGTCSQDYEQTIDIAQALGMAPGLASVDVYIGSDSYLVYSAMTTHNPLPATIGTSWDGGPFDPGLDPYFEKMAAQGQTFFASSGDDGIWSNASSGSGGGVASSDYAVAVGGTELVTTGAGGAWHSEVAWELQNQADYLMNACCATGGGISPDGVPIPPWQLTIPTPNGGSRVYRMGPDVAANAESFYACGRQQQLNGSYQQSCGGGYGGTSFAAPMWAGYAALVNQQAATMGEAPVGFISPALYAIGSPGFHDITLGSTYAYNGVSLYRAAVGYDLVSGWGSPDGSTLINALTAIGSHQIQLTAAPNQLTVEQGGTITTTISKVFLEGSVPWGLHASGVPAGVTASFSPDDSKLTFAVSSATPGTYLITITATLGGAPQGTTLGTTNVTFTIAPTVAHDFNGDGTSDIVWGNSNGDVVIWFMNGGSIASSADLGVIPNGWTIQGSGDFGGDGKADILWRNGNGDLVIWFMNGGTVASSADLGVIPSSWTIQGIGDFNGDGKTDILWRNSNGDVVIWFMNGGTIASSADLGVTASSWTIQGTGDFNRDGKADILWRNSSGDVVVWFMNGDAIASSADLGVIPSTWTTQRTGDFNGDGTSDILWRNSNGEVVIWFMESGSIASSADFGMIPTSWTIQGTGDFNGDGKADILWGNSNGDVVVWLMNGSTIASSKDLGVVASSWVIQP